MKSVISKIKLNGLGTDDQIQFKLRGEEVDYSILQIRKNDDCVISVEDNQASLIDNKTGEVKSGFQKFRFTATSVSISITALEEEVIVTITISTDDDDVLVKIAELGLIGGSVELSFIS